MLGSRRSVVVAALCGAGLAACTSSNWPAYRNGRERSGDQGSASALSDPARVPGLAVRWFWEVPTDRRAFRASPIVHRGRVYVGNGNGYFYALDAGSGAVLWQFPAATDPALTSAFTCNASSRGLASSAALAKIKVRW